MALKVQRAYSNIMVFSLCTIAVSTFIHDRILSADRHNYDVRRNTRKSLENVKYQSYPSLLNQLASSLPGPSCQYNASFIDCSDRNLRKVPTEKFPDTAISYCLQDNLITSISDSAFSLYKHLENLYLSHNNISALSNLSFWGLAHLAYLDLSHNKLIMTPTMFPSEVFAPLVSLQDLQLRANTPFESLNRTDLSYPHLALSKLTSLNYLSIDGLTSRDLGPGFQHMTRLTRLDISGKPFGNCMLYSLSNSMFQYVRRLKFLDIDNCGLVGHKIELEAFLPLGHLSTLNIQDNDNVGSEHLNTIFYGLSNTSSLETLYMSKIVTPHSIGICLESSLISHFPQHLKKLFASENVLEGVDRDVIEKLSPSLTFLDLSANNFAFGTYFLDLHKMRNLRELHYNGDDKVHSLPRTYPYGSNNIQTHDFSGSNCSLHERRNGDPSRYETLILRLPPKLQTVEMNRIGLREDVTSFDIDPNNKLENLSMEGNYFPRLEGPISGLHSLKRLNLGSNSIKKISTSFFQLLNALEALDLSSNLLGQFFSTATKSSVFFHLTNLTKLNLTFNDIAHFPKDTFINLISMQALILGNNPLEDFDVDISNMRKLEYLDLQNTRVAFLPVDTRSHIKSLINQSHPSIKLNMALTPIACNCQHLDFLQWLTNSKVIVKDKSNYRCLYPDSSIRAISDFYSSTLEDLNKECTTHTILFFCSGAITFLVLAIMFGTVVYRFRWKLRYLYYAAYLHYKRIPETAENDFEFDAFISYDTTDIRFVKGKLLPELERRGLKLLIHNRHFTAGEPIASNIVRAVCNSRKTVVVLTRALMDSYWCGFEIQMANMESLEKSRRVLIFLLMEKIPQNELGVELLYNIRNNTYIPFPDPIPDEMSMGRLWDKLATDIRS